MGDVWSAQATWSAWRLAGGHLNTGLKSHALTCEHLTDVFFASGSSVQPGPINLYHAGISSHLLDLRSRLGVMLDVMHQKQ